jgi:TetR/AcrR family transcriptional regulator, tetracycline repressor protein
MKLNREKIVRAGLSLLNRVGLERLTLRLLGADLNIQAPTLYWHFKSKEELLDAMATLVLAEGAPRLTAARTSGDWNQWATKFGMGLRGTLLDYRDGARMISGTRLTNTVYMKTVERIGAQLIAGGLTLRQTVVLLSTIYNYTLSFVLEEQVVYPQRGERSPHYDIAKRNAQLDPRELPLSRKAGSILFENFDRRYREGLALIVSGATPKRSRPRNRRASRLHNVKPRRRR